MRDRDGRVTLTKAEMTALRVVVAGGAEGALLSGATRPKLGLIESRTARRLARQGLLTIDAGAGAQLTDRARELLL